MRSYLSLCLLALIVASPAFGKAKPKGKAGKTSGNYAVVQDLSTGGCDVRKLDFQADAPLGVTVLGLYQTEKQADAAKGSAAECQNKPTQRDSAYLHAVERDCQGQAKKSDATLLSLLTDLTSGGGKQQAYAACMKAHGYNVNQ